MLFRREFLEKVIRPKVEEAAREKPETLYDLCALFGLPPGSIHTVAAWLRDLRIPVEDVCELPPRARRMTVPEGSGFDRYGKDSFIDSGKSVANARHPASVAKKEEAEEEVIGKAAQEADAVYPSGAARHAPRRKKTKKKSAVTVSRSGKKKKQGTNVRALSGNKVRNKVVKSRRYI